MNGIGWVAIGFILSLFWPPYCIKYIFPFPLIPVDGIGIAIGLPNRVDAVNTAASTLFQILTLFVYLFSPVVLVDVFTNSHGNAIRQHQ
jgi:hypothetical protein